MDTATRKKWQGLVADLRAQLREAQVRADENYCLYQNLRRETDKAIRVAEKAIKRAEAAERRLKYHHASYPLPKKPPQPVQLGDDYNPDLCRFCREADWEAPAEAQARQKEGSDA